MSSTAGTTTTWLPLVAALIALAGAILVALIALAGAILSSWLSFRSSQKSVALESIRVLGDAASPNYAKMLALATMLEKRLLPADALLDAAYAVEDAHGQRVTLQLLYLIGRGTGRIPVGPVGYVDQPEGRVLKQEPDGKYRVRGWAIDDKKVTVIELWIDGKRSSAGWSPGSERPDIASLFRRLGHPANYSPRASSWGPSRQSQERRRTCACVCLIASTTSGRYSRGKCSLSRPDA